MEIANKTLVQLVEELQQIPFFEDLRPEQLGEKVPFLAEVDPRLIPKVTSQSLLLQYQPGELICRQGDYETSFYLLLTGEVEVETVNQHHERILLTILRKGDFFGEIASLSGQARTATVRAKSRTVVLQIPHDLFLEIHESSEAVRNKIDRMYRDRLLKTHLRQVSLFSSLPDEFVDELKEKVELISFPKGAVIIRQGEPGDSFYLVRSGFVKVSQGPLEQEKILTYLRGGSYFGEMALLAEVTRSANVTAITEVEAIRIWKTDFQEILRHYPQVRADLEAMVSLREEDAKTLTLDERRAKALSFVVKKGLVQARQILVINLEKCTGCGHCETACAAVRGASRLERCGSRLGPYLIPTSCFHCENPECLLCEFGGIVRDKNGEVHHTEFCIGCGRCARRCPYGNILVVKEERGRRFARWRKKAGEERTKGGRHQLVKCDMCTDYPQMACAYNCPMVAIEVLTPEALIAAYQQE